jgi:curved DNA-binding protein CbpA
LKNYYEILGIDHDADDPTIKKAYLSLVKQFHPDSPLSKELKDAKIKFARIKEAYETLMDRDLRKTYDKYVLQKMQRKPAKTDVSDDDRTILFYEQGREHYKAGRYQSASKAFQTALNLDQDNALYCSWLGLTMSHIPGRARDSKKWCEKAIELSPGNADYHVNLAIVYKDVGINTKARALLNKAIALDPQHKRARSWLKEYDRPLTMREMLRHIFKWITRK